ncbi:MAG: hypothetical protein ABIA93_05950 [Candidatus Woesearchaeota archaeon]
MKALLVIMIVAGLMLAACTAGNTSQPKPADDNNAANQETAPSGDSAGTTDDSMKNEKIAPADDASAEWKSLVGKNVGLSFMVKYEVQSNANGQATNAEMTQYSKSGKSRVDSMAQGMESRAYMMDNKVYSCINQGTWMCFAADSQQDSGADLTKYNDDSKAYQVTAMPSRNIAGKTAKCFQIIVESAKAQYCLSPEGVPLYIMSEGSEGGVSYTSTMTAKEYSTSVSDLVFELPAEPTAMPTY